MRILLAQINPTVGDLSGNTDKILKAIAEGKKRSADIVLFPELCLTGYPPEDFLLLPHFIAALQNPLEQIREATQGIIAIVGTPRVNPRQTEKHVRNSAAIFADKRLLGYQDKALLPTYDVFFERRYFEPSYDMHIWELCGKRVGITICEDLWQHSALVMETDYMRDPVLELLPQRPEVLLNLSASPFSVGKPQKRLTVCSKAAETLRCPVLLCNQVGGNNGLIFDGYSVHVDASGQLMHQANGFQEDYLLVDLSQKQHPCALNVSPIPSLYHALVLGLRDYFVKSGFSKACLGLSGGIDSALVASIAVEALGKQNVLGIIMPSRFSSPGSVTDAIKLAQNLGVQYREIPIEEPFQGYLNLLGPHFENMPPDVTEENLQARIRGMILMAISNKLGYIVLSTGNKSEMALGYCTLYGDMVGGLGVISDVTKRQVYELSRWINRKEEVIPWNTIYKPPSAELRTNQKDSDSLPDYDIIDNVVRAYVEEHHSPSEIAFMFKYPLELVNDLIKRIHRNEYKRRQSPPGLRVSEKSFSVGRLFPIVQRWV